MLINVTKNPTIETEENLNTLYIHKRETLTKVRTRAREKEKTKTLLRKGFFLSF